MIVFVISNLLMWVCAVLLAVHSFNICRYRELTKMLTQKAAQDGQRARELAEKYAESPTHHLYFLECAIRSDALVAQGNEMIGRMNRNPIVRLADWYEDRLDAKLEREEEAKSNAE